jgi:hypothetical protein
VGDPDEPFWRTPSNQEWAEGKAWVRGFMAKRRELETLARREWINEVRRRLGLVAEVHRCQVFRGKEWLWSCLRHGCNAAGYSCPSQADAFAKAFAHARRFVPQPPEEEPLTELQWALYVAFSEDAERQREADEAALGARIAAVTEQVGDAFAGVLPPGMRFEWRADGE